MRAEYPDIPIPGAFQNISLVQRAGQGQEKPRSFYTALVQGWALLQEHPSPQLFRDLLDFSYTTLPPLCSAPSPSKDSRVVYYHMVRKKAGAETEEAQICVLSLLSAYCVTLGELRDPVWRIWLVSGRARIEPSPHQYDSQPWVRWESGNMVWQKREDRHNKYLPDPAPLLCLGVPLSSICSVVKTPNRLISRSRGLCGEDGQSPLVSRCFLCHLSHHFTASLLQAHGKLLCGLRLA